MTTCLESVSRISDTGNATGRRRDCIFASTTSSGNPGLLGGVVIVGKSSTRCFFAAFVFFISGCGIFETRQPQPPQQVQSNFSPPTSSDIVIANLINAIAEKNLDDYLLCMSDTSLGTYGGRKFVFIPPVEIFNANQSKFMSWDRNSESAYFNNLIRQSPSSLSPSLSLSSVSSLSLGIDSVQYSANYVLFWPTTGQSLPSTFQGYLQFVIGVDKNQNWAIYRWIDSPVGDSSTTWSELKARLSQ